MSVEQNMLGMWINRFLVRPVGKIEGELLQGKGDDVQNGQKARKKRWDWRGSREIKDRSGRAWGPKSWEWSTRP